MAGTPNIVVIDYESGNLRSVAKALEAAGVSPVVTSDPAVIAKADALILPGVGSGPAAMAALEKRALVQPIRDYAKSGKPFLGICLGLQLFLERTEEGDAACLGIVEGRVKRLPDGSNEMPGGMKIPHMGWNSVHLASQHPILYGVDQDSYFYFVHSYYAQPSDASAVAGSTDYGVTFCSILAKENLVATQFHPEKSGAMGLRIYQNFVAMAGKRSAAGARPSAGA
ncbi:MAG: imidazole glycerol phosphate synthase subunit HisH [SAR202 cluster bacterium Io17-Chloro-G2]|nr:MAG: imidazole glycerol phosphate synthase subunit HisH [SAR202 cluster bacterium Io17-Chloro-G2]